MPSVYFTSRRLRRAVRIVIIADRAADADGKGILAAGADAYFIKPYPMAEMVSALSGQDKAGK